MKTPNKFCWAVGMIAILASLYAQAYPGESIVLDPATGDYSITYWDDEEPAGLEQTTFVPATKIAPTIRSKFRMDGASDVTYSYIVSNGATAKQAIIAVSLEETARIKGERDFPARTATVEEVRQVLFANMSALNSPENWSGNIYTVRGQSKIAWNPDDLKTGGVKAGRTQAGFGFSSLALPGISEARMEGIGAVFGYAGEGPAMDSAIRPELERLQQNDFIARPAAVPTIPVPTPFDPAIVLERIQTHTHTWIGMQLLDPTFSSQLDRYLTAAADAYRLNDTHAGKEHIMALRKMLAKEHRNLDGDDGDDDSDKERKAATLPGIDRLAARVLDFDLRYALERAHKGKDKD